MDRERRSGYHKLTYTWLTTFIPPTMVRTSRLKDYLQLWKGVTSAIDEAKAAQILAVILADKPGRRFILDLNSEDAKSCIKILDHVSRDLHLPAPPPQTVPSEHRREPPQTCREEEFPSHVEETC